MKRIICIAFICLLSFNIGLAQTGGSDTLRLSLKQAQELGLKNRYDILARGYDIDIADREVTSKKQAYLPNIKATGNVQYRPQIQSTLIPAGFIGITEPKILALGAKSIGVFGLELNQHIYNPVIAVDVKAARNAEALQKEKIHGDEIEIKKRISLAYLNMGLRELQLQIAHEEEARYFEYFTLANGRYKNGALIENDYLRAKLDYENAQQQTKICEQNYIESQTTLCFQINIDSKTKLKLIDSLAHTDADLLLDTIDSGKNRTEMRQLYLQEENLKIQNQRQRKSVLPVVSFYANYSIQYLNQGFYNELFQSKWWLPYNALGISISLPITGQFTNENNLEKIQLHQLQLKAQEQQLNADIQYQISQSATELINADKNLHTTKENYNLSRQVYENEQQQLALGDLSYDTILNTEATLIKTESNYISAVYQYMVARLNYLLAIGKL